MLVQCARGVLVVLWCVRDLLVLVVLCVYGRGVLVVCVRVRVCGVCVSVLVVCSCSWCLRVVFLWCDRGVRVI